MVVSALALSANVAVVTFHFGRVIKNKRNPFKDEIYKDLKQYKQILSENKLNF
ncbi:MAG: DUF5692 family protein [Clostridium sp.]|uniref:DUF5692 family protein n=1 Tax=Clostridium sp. TaxID=1506 RepID=UPI003D6D4F36